MRALTGTHSTEVRQLNAPADLQKKKDHSQSGAWVITEGFTPFCTVTNLEQEKTDNSKLDAGKPETTMYELFPWLTQAVMGRISAGGKTYSEMPNLPQGLNRHHKGPHPRIGKSDISRCCAI